MSQIQKIQSRQDTEYPYPRELYPYAVRIKCSDPSDSCESLGTGILFNHNNTFKVLTARHCIYKNDGTQFDIANIVFGFAEDEERIFNAIRIVDISEDEDFAVIEVDFVPMHYQAALYDKSPLFVGEPFARMTKTYGYSKSYPKGTSIKVEYVSPETYRSLEGILAAGRDLEMIRGFSGGGIYTKIGSQIICEGFIKSKFDSPERLEEILVGSVPNLGDNIWIEKFDLAIGQEPYISSGNNSAKIEYIEAWRNLLGKINSGNDCSEELQQVLEKRKTYRLSKSDSYQEQVIWSLFRKEGNWSKDEQHAFLIALSDLGQWPALYGELPEKAGSVQKNPACLSLLHRAASLYCDESIEPIALNKNEDRDIYELILRALYKLDFGEATSLCISWSPKSGDYFSKKLILLHLLNKEDEELSQKLDERIEQKPSGLEVAFIDTVIANQCDFQIPSKHSYEDYNKSGLDSPGEVLSSILNKIGKQEEKVSLYGVHTTELLNNPNSSSFPAALRVINYIIESGIPPSDGFVWTISTYNWLKVFKRLFRNFPNPIIFYSLLYRDEKLIRRIGQEMAFTDDNEFREELPKIVIRLLKALASDSTPYRMISSIFLMVGELFCSIDSSQWVEEFHSVIRIYFKNGSLKNLSYRDDFSKFLIKGIKAIKKVEDRVKIMITIGDYFNENPIVFSHIIVNGLNIDEHLSVNEQFGASIEKILTENSFSQINLLVAQLNYHNLLTGDWRNIIYKKIESEGLDFAKGHNDVIHNLTYIIPEERINELKKLILEINIWDCGIKGSSYRTVEDLEIESISEAIVWTEDERNQILRNLTENLSIIEGVEATERFAGFMKSSVERLLGRMLRYLSQNRNTSEFDVSIIKDRVEKELNKWTQSNSLLERLAKGDYNQITDSLNDLIQQARTFGIDNVKKELGFIINQAISKNKPALSNIIEVISYLTTVYPKEIVIEFKEELLLLLKSFCGYNYEELHLHVPYINRRLVNMAKAMSPFCPGDNAINYWLSEKVQNRFYGE